jgi:hypothetical protein
MPCASVLACGWSRAGQVPRSCQRRKLDALDADVVVVGQVGPDRVIAAGEHPHRRQASQPGHQAARQEPADPVGPLQIIDRYEQWLEGSEVFQAGHGAVGERQRLSDQACDLHALCRRG